MGEHIFGWENTFCRARVFQAAACCLILANFGSITGFDSFLFQPCHLHRGVLQFVWRQNVLRQFHRLPGIGKGIAIVTWCTFVPQKKWRTVGTFSSDLRAAATCIIEYHWCFFGMVCLCWGTSCQTQDLGRPSYHHIYWDTLLGWAVCGADEHVARNIDVSWFVLVWKHCSSRMLLLFLGIRYFAAVSTSRSFCRYFQVFWHFVVILKQTKLCIWIRCTVTPFRNGYH